MYLKGNQYNTRIPTLAKGERDEKPRMYVKDELFEGNPMDSENGVHFDYLGNKPQNAKKDRYAELKALNKDEQSEMLKKLGSKTIPSTEDGRIKQIIQLEVD